jgi:hypothetical protein
MELYHHSYVPSCHGWGQLYLLKFTYISVFLFYLLDVLDVLQKHFARILCKSSAEFGQFQSYLLRIGGVIIVISKLVLSSLNLIG